MIECVFTIDYEIYGNGEGSLRELVYEPAEQLMSLFNKWQVRFVPFIEVAELELIEKEKSDQDIDLVKNQIRVFHKEGFELGLHIHPQWYNSSYENGKWFLDYGEYNLCVLPKERIAKIIEKGITYLRETVGEMNFTPVSYRAGNWLFQPTKEMAEVLVQCGVRVDSSVFKGGVQHKHALDYRRSLKNGSFWKFQDDVNVIDQGGGLLELPIFTQMVPFWKMITTKRLGLQKKSSSASHVKRSGKLERIRDYLRLRYPLKFDFCRMTIEELISMLEKVIKEDEKDPSIYRPLVAIGHTKDLEDFKVVDEFLSYLQSKDIGIATFGDVLNSCK